MINDVNVGGGDVDCCVAQQLLLSLIARGCGLGGGLLERGEANQIRATMSGSCAQTIAGGGTSPFGPAIMRAKMCEPIWTKMTN